MRSGITHDESVAPVFRTGVIRYYHVDKGSYRVTLDGQNEAIARPLKNGAYRPYPSGTRVLCVRVPTTTWLVLGEIEPSQVPNEVPLSPDEAIQKKDAEFRRTVSTRYSVEDAALGDPAERKALEGDALVANRRAPQSFVHLYSSGDVLAYASSFCFMLLSAVKRLFYVWAKEAFLYFAGLVIKTTVSDDNKTAKVDLVINSDPADAEDRDLTFKAGYLGGDNLPSAAVSEKTKGAKIEEGLWALFGDHTLLEVDNTRRELRISGVSIKSNTESALKKSLTQNRRQIRMNQDETVVCWQEKDHEISVKKDGVRARWGTSDLEITDDAVHLKQGDVGFFIDKDRLAARWSNAVKMVLNSNGVQIGGLLELVGPGIRFTETAEDGVAAGAQPNLAVSVMGSSLQWTVQGGLVDLEVASNMTVRKRALVDERFFTSYDLDMTTIRGHIHPVPPVLQAIVSPTIAMVDTPTTAGRKSVLSSKEGA